MKAIESKGYGKQYNKGYNSGGSGAVGGFFKGVLTLAVLICLVLMIADRMGGGKEAAQPGNVIPNVVVNVPGAYVESNSDGKEVAEKDVEEEVRVPISTQYSCQGNYYSVFTQKQDVTDNCGTTYETANVAVVGSLGSAKKLTYKLDGSFTKLRGTIALAEQDKDRINYFRVYVYNDKGDCIYQSADISDKSPDPIEVNCNISGLEQITIEMEGVSTSCSTVSVIMPDEGFVFSGLSGVVDANT